jgi:dTDP-4-amino-4,6-dideoxygalactose transaminase
MKYNSFEIVKEFENEISKLTNSKFAVAVDSCTNGIFLVCKYLEVKNVTIPSKTYLSVPNSIIHAGGKVVFDTTNETNNWQGIYQLKPYPIFDSALRLKKDMYIPGSYMCLSFHYKKNLPIGKGGMILCDDLDAYNWFKRARYEGRGELPYKEDNIETLGWNMYMTPEQAARGLHLLQFYNEMTPDKVESGGYKDLREFTVFKNFEFI